MYLFREINSVVKRCFHINCYQSVRVNFQTFRTVKLKISKLELFFIWYQERVPLLLSLGYLGLSRLWRAMFEMSMKGCVTFWHSCSGMADLKRTLMRKALSADRYIKRILTPSHNWAINSLSPAVWYLCCHDVPLWPMKYDITKSYNNKKETVLLYPKLVHVMKMRILFSFRSEIKGVGKMMNESEIAENFWKQNW